MLHKNRMNLNVILAKKIHVQKHLNTYLKKNVTFVKKESLDQKILNAILINS